jgi:hypothetical protein
MAPNRTRSAVTFLVRISHDACGRLTGVVERVKTGEKERFLGADGLGRLIERMSTDIEGGRATP